MVGSRVRGDRRALPAVVRAGSVAACAVALTLSALVAGPAAQALDEPQPSAVPSVGVTPAPSPDPTVTPTPEAKAILPGSVTLEGSPASGRSIQAVIADWEPDVAVSFQWLRNGVPVDGSTSASHPITAADAGAAVSVVVTGTREGSEPVRVTSSPVMVPEQLTGSIPTITGSVVQGGTVTALAGVWPAGTSLNYQWLRNGADIDGATRSTYVLTSADGGQKVSVRITGTLAGRLDAAKTSAQVSVLRAMTTSAPTLSGAVKVGSLLTARPGAWVAGASFTYQWLRNGVPIAGAVTPAYRLAPADAAAAIAVRVTGTQAEYAPATRTGSAVLVPRVLTAAVPGYTGQALLGAVLSAKNGAWTAGTTFRYQWYRNGSMIAGATRTTYTLVSADLGARLTLRVSGSKAGYAPESRLSGLSGVIRRPAPVLWRQNDPRWANIRVGVSRIGPSGCVPTATAMALWSEGVKVGPYNVALTMNRVGDYNRTISGAGSRSIVAAARYYGVKATPITNVAALRASLKAGHSVVALMRGPASITWPGTTHAITLSGFSANGSTFVRNPYAGTVNDWYHTDTLWFYQSLDSFDRNAGAVFWQIG